MTKAGSYFVLFAHFGALLYIDEKRGELAQGLLGEVPVNLIFEEADGELRVCTALSSTHKGLDLTSWVVEDGPRDGFITLRAGEHYACSEPRGTIAFSRKEVNAWELFRRMPLSELHNLSFANRMTVPKLRPRRAIPKVIHQTYMRRELPPRVSRNVRILRERNPDYEHRLWVDEEVEDFIHDEYGADILRQFRSIDAKYGASRADLFRYLCVYRLGGAYLDIKSNTLQPLSTFLRDDDQYILAQWNRDVRWYRKSGLYTELSHVKGGEYQQWHVIAAPGHPFLERVINQVLHNISSYDPVGHGVGKRAVLRVTGPIAYTLAISKILGQHSHRFVVCEEVGLQYKAVKNYQKAFTTHYSVLETPVVLENAS